MRNFNVTDEPSGSAAEKRSTAKVKPGNTPSEGLPFVIQKHAATRLHYDFRLGWNGVLKSWAVAKGPSYNPHDKRLAVQVEDHPIEYGGFEGIIPKGQYGGGTVMLWDVGTWEPQAGHTDVEAGLKNGSLKFTMHGKKLKGNWALIRMGGKAANASKPNWLLIKEHDSFERDDSNPNITDEMPDSVVTGRSLNEIAKQQDHVWNSKETAGETALTRQNPPADKYDEVGKGRKRKRRLDRPNADDFSLQDYPKEGLPSFIAPELASQSDIAIDRQGWLHELKLDGYRIQARKDGEAVQLFTRSGLDWTHRMRPIAAEVAKIKANSALLDGEVVVLSVDGRTSFADLQAAFKDGEKHTLTFFVFDLLHLDGHNLRDAGLIARKQILTHLLKRSDLSEDLLRLSEHLEMDGSDVFRHACQLNAEGIISKRSDSKYISGRTSDWMKVKCVYEQEFVVGGFTLPSSGSEGVGALLLGYYDATGNLIYAGRTGTGFTRKTHRSLRAELDPLRTATSPFFNIPAAGRKKAIWTKPLLVAQVRYATWTADDVVRQASFQGLREDKPAGEVRRERAIPSNETDGGQKISEDLDQIKTLKADTDLSGGKRSEGGKHSSPNVSRAAVKLTHPDKILDLESNVSKQQLAEYYWQIAEYMLPYIAHRPLSIVRCPEGSTQPCFFQKHTNTMLPAGIGKVDVPDKKTGKLEPYITLSTPEALTGLAQLGVLEIHPWGSRNDDLERPDNIIFDLDPDESISWKTLASAAEQARSLLMRIGLDSFLKSTGGKGLHVMVPLRPTHPWQVIKQFAHAIALHLEARDPKLYLTKMSKSARKGKIFIDYLRNERGSTAIAAFSPRARAGLPVSVPLAWKELNGNELPRFTVAAYSAWKARLNRDPWRKAPELMQDLNLERIGEVLG